MKPTADEIRQAAEKEMANLKLKSMPEENELHVPITMNGYFYLVIFCRDSTSHETDSWSFDSIIER